MGIGVGREGAESLRVFESIYRTHHRYVWQSLRAFGVPDTMVDDAVQDVFLVVYRRLGEFEGRAKLRTWLFEILRRVAWRYRTKAQREATRWDVLPEVAGSVDLEADIERTRAFALLQRFVEELDEDRLHVFTLSVFGQLRGREIAEALGVNLNTVYARLRSAHAAFDRFATRLKAREATAMLRAARASRPARARARRTWAALVVQVSAGSKGLTVAGAAGASWTAWAATGTAAVVASITAAVIVAKTPAETRPEPIVQQAVRPDDANVPAERSVSAASTVTPFEPSPASTEVEPRPTTTASRSVRPRPSLPASPSPQPAARRLAAEVAAVEHLQAIADGNGSVAAEVERYRREFPQGTLREEVEALAIEDLCRRGSTAAAERSAFERRWPRSTLLRHLRTSCVPSIPPQKPRGSETPPP